MKRITATAMAALVMLAGCQTSETNFMREAIAYRIATDQSPMRPMIAGAILGTNPSTTLANANTNAGLRSGKVRSP